jgi:3-methyl-2-oxobutanoate hydroxymethyltransferase
MHAVDEFARAKAARRKISVVTAYDAWSARLVARSNVDAILVGDSAAMVIHGHETTLPATLGLMAMHTRAVAHAADGKFVIADLPFLSYRKGMPAAMTAVGVLVRNGAQAVKLEGVDGHEDVIGQIVGSGVPVMGHLGLTPQSVNGLGGFRVQGRNDVDAAKLASQAHELERLGCFAIVLECMPAALAARITSALTIPTIGIGAGPSTDGQVLVLQDLWGVDSGPSPRFVRHYVDGEAVLTNALNEYDADVKETRFPAPEETYS